MENNKEYIELEKIYISYTFKDIFKSIIIDKVINNKFVSDIIDKMYVDNKI